MGKVTRRVAALTLLSGVASCQSDDDLLVDLVIQEGRLNDFKIGLSRFARDQGLREREHTTDEYNFGGGGIHLSVLLSPPANGEIDGAAFIIKGLFSLASAQGIREFAHSLVEAMNSIDGVTASIDTP